MLAVLLLHGVHYYFLTSCMQLPHIACFMFIFPIPASPLNGLTPQSTKLMKPMSTVVEEHSLQSVPECGIDDIAELCDQINVCFSFYSCLLCVLGSINYFLHLFLHQNMTNKSIHCSFLGSKE